MTAFTGTLLSYTAIGIRESINDLISNISPEDTPILTGSSKGSVPQKLNEWQQDVLAAAVTTNAQLEGDDITSFTTVVPTVRLGNYQQISRKLVMVSDSEEQMTKAGRNSEMAYQVTKLSAELKRDMESTWTSNQAANAGGATTARTTAGLDAWIKTNVNATVTANSPSYTTLPNATRTDGAARTFTVAMLQSAISSCWTAGGKPTTILVSAKNKILFSGFAGVVTGTIYQTKADQAAIVGAADVYVSDFGKFTIKPSHFIRDKDVYILQMDMLQTDYFRKYQVKDLAKTGDASKKMIVCEWGTRVKNEAAIGLMADGGL